MGREFILENIRKNKPESKPVPGRFKGKTVMTESESLSLFKENLGKAGAEVVELNNLSMVSSHLRAKDGSVVDFRNRTVWKGYQSENAKSELEKVSAALIEGHFGVAENGAIWTGDAHFPHRLLPFITQELLLLLEQKRIVSDMHEAYRRIKLKDVGFGIFISGPSKTADIEQSLVYGAHGPKKLTVILVPEH